MNKQLIDSLVGDVVLDETLLETVVGGHDCNPPSTTGCPPSTTRPIQCGGVTTPNFSCMPPGMQCY